MAGEWDEGADNWLRWARTPGFDSRRYRRWSDVPLFLNVRAVRR